MLIHSDILKVAQALNHSLEIRPESLPELFPLFAVGLVMTQRELLMHLWRHEVDA